MIEHKKNTAYYLSFPAIDATAPDKYKTGITPIASAVYKDGSGAWTTLVLAGGVTEIGTLGIYELTFTAAELNHDKVTVKLSVSGMADDAFQFDLATKVVTDLNDIPATDIVSAGAITTLSGSVVSVDSTDTVVDGAKSSTVLDKTVWTDAKAAFIDAAITTRNSVAPDNAGITGIQSDLSNATDGLGALKADIASRMAETSINTTGGKVDSVSLVDLVTVTSNMRGTDNANTVVPDVAGTAPSVSEITADIDLNSSILATINTKTINLPVDPASDTNINASETKIDLLSSDVTQMLEGTIRKNVAGATQLLITDSGGVPLVGVAVTGRTKIDTAAFIPMTGVIGVTDLEGVCHVAYSSADVNGVKTVTFKLSAVGADDALLTLQLT